MKTASTKKTVLLVFASMFSILSFGQVYQKVGNGLSVPSNYMYGENITTHNGNVYVSYSGYNGSLSTTISMVERWDGLAWHQYPQLVGIEISDIEVYNNDIYVSSRNYSTGGNVYKFDGTNWVPVFANLTGFVNSLEVHNGKLVCAGAFTESTSSAQNLLGYDGTSISTYPPIGQYDSIQNMKIINNEIWVMGYFYGSNLADTASIKRLAGGMSWDYPIIAHKPVDLYSDCFNVFEYNNKVYSFESAGLYEVRNDTAHFITNKYSQSVAEHNGKMYFANGWGTMDLFDGTTVSSIAGSPMDVGAVVSENGFLYGAFSDTNKINGQDYNHVFKTNAQFGLMQGITFVDKNANCTYEASIDEPVSRMRLSSTSGPQVNFSSDKKGDYQVALTPGNYVFSQGKAFVSLNKYLIPDCNSASSVPIAVGQNVQKDFVLKHDGTLDLESKISAYRGVWARQGFTEYYKLKLSNPGIAVNSPLTLTLTVPSTVSFVSSVPVASSVSGNVYTYTFSSIAEREEIEVELRFKIDLTQNPIGSTIEYYSSVSSAATEVDYANNHDTIRLGVIAACDPNDKTPSVDKALPGLSSLDYHIRFQNTGTDTAFKVVIADTLESYLKVEELTINDASHDYDFKVLDGNVLVWTFDNILLPDSGANQIESQGYVDFTIGVDNTLPIGSIIDNDAEIYFDYQPAVHTNHAKTAIVMWLSSEEIETQNLNLSVYPNPAKEVLNVKNSESVDLEFQLLNNAGQIIQEFKVKANQVEQIDLNSLSTGMYILKSNKDSYKIMVSQ